MKKKGTRGNRLWATVRFCVMVPLFLCFNMEVQSQEYVTLNLKNANLEQIIEALKSQTRLRFLYQEEKLAGKPRQDVQVKELLLPEALQIVLRNTGLTWEVLDDVVIIKDAQEQPVPDMKTFTCRGKAVDMEGKPLPGVTIVLQGTTLGVITDVGGNFQIVLQKGKAQILVFSFIGMKTKEVVVKNEEILKVVLEENVEDLDEVVVTGIYTRKKESFTGSSATYKAEDLKVVGAQNIIQSLRTLDPAFNVLQSKEYGSDPNRLPDIEIRGKSSIVGLKEEFGQDPNQPLFILDGFETTLQTIVDLNMDRVASVTILKDAASTAIYGAKAANGVVVVETKAPASGKLRLNYNGSAEISFADLTDYNLMNAEEKLEFEKLSGVFDSNLATTQEWLDQRYNRLLENVKRGVDSYWMSEPLRLGITHRHNLFMEGGDGQMRYGLGVNYSGIQGVMKNSVRHIMGLSLDLIYRKNKFNFMNKLSIDWNNSDNPIVQFSEYAGTNPYYEKKSGSNERWLEDWSVNNIAMTGNQYYRAANPLYNDSQNSYNKADGFNVRDNFSVEIRPVDVLVIRGRFGLTKSVGETEVFTSPNATRFENTRPVYKGSYSNTRSDALNYDADFTVTYGQLLNEKHMVNIAAGVSINENSSEAKSFTAQGFPEGNFTKPSFANQYPEGGKPGYSESKSRTANFYLNGGYSFDNRYLLDVNLRSDGTSVFGANKRFSTTWAVGVGWNIHNEKFVSDNTSLFTMLKIRASVGNPGNQNFGSYSAITTYQFNNWMLNNFGTGLLVATFGDPNLEWQRTLDKNVGFDISMFANRFHLNFDYYHKRTDPLIANINMPVSMGVTTRRANVGIQVDQGFNGTIRYAFLYKPKLGINYTMSLNFRYGKAYYDEIGRKLDQYNQENLTKNMVRYYDGGSPTALWAVRSRGIDPATGKEIFVKKDGTLTYDFDYNDEVELGDTRPTLEGVWGNTFYWKGFSAALHVRYSFGADAFNTTLFNKVENISFESLTTNQDKRALYNRWKKPGDKAKFKSISLTDATPMSSRFVMKENYIEIESVNIGYQFNAGRLKKTLGISSMSINAYMNSIARFSTLEDERGIYYPFARSISFALSIIL